MKNCVNHTSKVNYLVKWGYGGDMSCCPYCGHVDAFSSYNLNHLNNMPTLKAKFDSKFEDDEFFKKWFYYCEDCKITFDNGCHYSDPGVADDGIYNAHIIRKYMFQGDVYEGTPLFDSIDEWLDLCDKVTVLEWCCPNNGLRDYDKEEYREVYDKYYKCALSTKKE
jgi:hypothetical protein